MRLEQVFKNKYVPPLCITFMRFSLVAHLTYFAYYLGRGCFLRVKGAD